MIHNLFPPIKLSQTEEDVLHGLLCHPTMKKYLLMLAQLDAQDIVLGQPQDGESAESYLRRQAVFKGRVEVLTNLLSVQPEGSPAV